MSCSVVRYWWCCPNDWEYRDWCKTGCCWRQTTGKSGWRERRSWKVSVSEWSASLAGSNNPWPHSVFTTEWKGNVIVCACVLLCHYEQFWGLGCRCSHNDLQSAAQKGRAHWIYVHRESESELRRPCHSALSTWLVTWMTNERIDRQVDGWLVEVNRWWMDGLMSNQLRMYCQAWVIWPCLFSKFCCEKNLYIPFWSYS